jgi:1-aminocyclopropane-1-carboxylate deaminase/D-cysteine desulfhydrase-like pyridoxal-dependent ACC family enzyme
MSEWLEMPRDGSEMVPVDRMDRLSAELEIDLRVVRDDLYPVAGGSTKARKATRVFRDLVPIPDAVVTTGGLQSNHARVTAVLAAYRGIACELVLHRPEDSSDSGVGMSNHGLCRLSGAKVHVVKPADIGPTVGSIVDGLRKEEKTVHVIPGGGHCRAGAESCADAAETMLKSLAAEGWTPDVVVLASGTGTTQAGVVLAAARMQMHLRVVGVSVAREAGRGEGGVREGIAFVDDALARDAEVEFRDEWICGGYGRASEKVWSTIRYAFRRGGLLLDPVYTGKAFTGMVDMINQGSISSGARVLFWNTGGTFNLIAALGDDSAMASGRK